MSLRRLRFDTELVEEADAGGDAVAQFDADFAIMSAELAEFIPALLHGINATRVE
ncbi:MAG: recombination-associated protein RdgC [Mariprofundaceae bacterium]